MLLGEHRRAIDAKGRLILPREYRQELGSGVVVAKGLDGCLSLYPLREWERVEERVNEMPSGSEDTRIFTRQLLTSAKHLVPDAQGRIMIPQQLRAMAGITSEVVIAGLSNKAELWNPGVWDDYMSAHDGRFESSASEIGI